MALNLNLNFDNIDAELDQYEWEWVNMGDDRVCPDCERLAEMLPASMTEWVTERTEPGRGDTVCGDHCRCAMVPTGLIEIYPDLKTEGKIVIDDGLLSSEVANMNISYKTFAELDDLIGEYKAVTGGRKLPSEYYELSVISKRIEFLADWLSENR